MIKLVDVIFEKQESWRDKLVPKDIEVRQKKLEQSEYVKLLDYIKNQSTESDLSIEHNIPSFPKQITKVRRLGISKQGNRMDLSNIKEILVLHVSNVNNIILPQEVKESVYISTIKGNLTIPQNFKCSSITIADHSNTVDLSSAKIKNINLRNTSQVIVPDIKVDRLTLKAPGKIIAPPNFFCEELDIYHEKNYPIIGDLLKTLKGKYKSLKGNIDIKDTIKEFPKEIENVHTLEIQDQENHMDLSNVKEVEILRLSNVKSVTLPKQVKGILKLDYVQKVSIPEELKCEKLDVRDSSNTYDSLFSTKLDCNSLSITSRRPVDLSQIRKLGNRLDIQEAPELKLPNCTVKEVLLKNVGEVADAPNFKCQDLKIDTRTGKADTFKIVKQVLPRVDSIDIKTNRLDITEVEKLNLSKQDYHKVKFNGTDIEKYSRISSLPDFVWNNKTEGKFTKVGEISKEQFVKLPNRNFDYVRKLPVKSIEVLQVYVLRSYTGFMAEFKAYDISFENTEEILRISSERSTVEFGGKEFNTLTAFYKTFVLKYGDSSTPDKATGSKKPSLRTLVSSTDKPVSMQLGRKRRNGNGFEGKYDEFKESFHVNTRNNLDRVKSIFDVEWENFIAFDNRGYMNFVIKGKLPNGDDIYYDNYGQGTGMKSTLFDKDFKEIPKNRWMTY